MLHGNVLHWPEKKQSRWLKQFHRTALRIDEATAEDLLDGVSWREHMVGAWFIGFRGWDQFTNRLSSMLLASKRTYEGQGFAVGLALLSTDQAAAGLDAYLTEWLPVLDARYDQPWAMGALAEVDERNGTMLSRQHHEAWRRWSAAGPGASVGLAPVRSILDLVRLGSG